MKNRHLSSQSSQDDKSSLQEAVFESLADYFFEKIVFINLAYSDLGGGGTTSTTNYDKDSRIIDTAEGRLMAPGRESRLRCQFYLKNPEELDGYILSPSVYDSQDTSGITTSLSPLRSYVGLKFLRGDVFAVTKEAGGKEKLFKLDLTLSMYDSQFTDTYALEIRHNNSSTEIVINGQSYGSFSSNLVGSFTKVETFYPFFSPARSTDGTSVNIVSENIQFIQSR